MDYYNRFNAPRLKGDFTTPYGVYYGVVTEMDRQIGRLLDKLNQLGLADDTIVLFSSDNGPKDISLRESAHSGVGHTGPFRGRKLCVGARNLGLDRSCGSFVEEFGTSSPSQPPNGYSPWRLETANESRCLSSRVV